MPAPLESVGRHERHAPKAGAVLSAIPLAVGSAGGGGQLLCGSRSAGCRAAHLSDLLRDVSERFGIGGMPLEGDLVHLSARSGASGEHAARAPDALRGLRSNHPGALLPGTHRGIEIRLAYGARLL